MWNSDSKSPICEEALLYLIAHVASDVLPVVNDNVKTGILKRSDGKAMEKEFP